MATMIQNNFVGGEISPALKARSDLGIYYKAAEKIENFVVSKEGTLTKRKGIVAQAQSAIEYDQVQLVPYVYDRDEAGVLAFYVSEGTIYARLRSKTALDSPGAAVEVAIAPSGFDVKTIRAEQLGDTFFATAKDVFNKKIVVTWATLSLAVSDYRQTGIPQNPFTISITSQPGGSRNHYYAAYIVKGGVLSEANTATGKTGSTWEAGQHIDIQINIPADWRSDDAFDYILLGKRSGSYYGELTRWYPSDCQEPIYGPDPEDPEQQIIVGYQWKTSVTFEDENHAAGEVIYTQTNTLGKVFHAPLIVNAFQQRLIFANAKSGETEQTLNDLPMTLWFSEIGDLYNFYTDRVAGDSDPFSPTIMSLGPSFIRWLVPYQKAMLCFTDAGIFAITGSTSEGFSAATCQISKLSNAAVSPNIKPIETDDGIIFVGADEKTLYTMAYDLQTDATRPVSRMFFAKHLTRTAKITSIALAQFPDNVVWCTLDDGSAISLTIEEKQEVFAWARHAIPGAKILEAIGTLTVTDNDADFTYGDVVFAVKKDDETGFRYALFGDGYADQLGETSNPVVATLRTLPPESQDATIKGVKKNVKDVILSLNESGPVKAVVADSGMTRVVAAAAATAENPFTGEAKIAPFGLIEERGQMEFKSDSATPCEILGIVYKMDIAG